MFRTIHDCNVELIAASSADDMFPCSAARVSFGKEQMTGTEPERDKKLMKYLADHKHLTPFEYQHATFMIECPLFIRSQIHRHRTFSFNEISRRYTDENLEFWIPDKWRKQSTSNKQASTDDEITVYAHDGLFVKDLDEAHEQHCQFAKSMYEDMIRCGVCREQARAILPQSLLTRFYMGGVLRNWAHFLELRLDGHAQYEVQVIAQKVYARLKELWPYSMEVLLGDKEKGN